MPPLDHLAEYDDDPNLELEDLELEDDPVSERTPGFLSLYLESASPETLPSGWKRFAHFILTIIDQNNPHYSITREAKHYFNAQNSYWGFKNFVPTAELIDPARGYVVNDRCIIQATVLVKEVGYSGLKFHVNSYYQNPMIQILYHIPYFRKVLFRIPEDEGISMHDNIPLLLQSVFYKMQHRVKVSTKTIIRACGLDDDSFLRHDLKRFNSFLFEKIDYKMKGTAVEGTIQRLFEGHRVSRIKCTKINYTSSKNEPFYGLCLDVKGCSNVYDSFDKCVEVKQNQEQYIKKRGFQKITMEKLFIDFPVVLMLHLRRFINGVKINDHYEFPLQLDLDRDNGKYLSSEADRSVRNLYTLHSVMGNHGVGCSTDKRYGITDKHYYAYIRPDLSNQWFEFDNEHVTKKVTMNALEGQYGGNKKRHASNACMLVYIRDSDKDEIMRDVYEEDIFEHVRARLKRKKDIEEGRKEAEAFIKVAWEAHFREHVGKDVFFGLVNRDKLKTIRASKEMPFDLFKGKVAEVSEVPIEQLLEVSSKANNAEVMLFLDEREQEFLEGELLLFFKHYDPADRTLRYVGRLHVPATGKPIDIVTELIEMANVSTDEGNIELFKEIKLIPTRVYKNSTFIANQLKHGDIIWYQTSPKDRNNEQFQDIPSFVKHLHYPVYFVQAHFRLLEKPKEDHFSIKLPTLYTYADVVKRVAELLSLNDPAKIRLTYHNCNTQLPETQPIKCEGFEHLSDVLVLYDKTSNVLYYEVLDTPLPELQSLLTVKVAFHNATGAEVIYTVRQTEQSTVEDVLNALKSKVDLSYPDAQLRLLEISHHKILQIIPVHEKLKNISSQLTAEEIAEKETNLGPDDQLISVCHFRQNKPLEGTSQNQLNYLSIENFGDPFLLVILGGETLASIKLRIQEKLQVTNEEFSKWKFAFLSDTDHSKYLQDSDILSIKFERNSSIWGQYLGLEHSDNGPVKQVSSERLRLAWERDIALPETLFHS
ncbi:ubiquitin carboxyl-terminal hydrolase [Trifolium repens]|nr:ubiquitin carboxyl-terminal hydrolase [Trifolium repens]